MENPTNVKADRRNDGAEIFRSISNTGVDRQVRPSQNVVESLEVAGILTPGKSFPPSHRELATMAFRVETFCTGYSGGAVSESH